MAHESRSASAGPVVLYRINGEKNALLYVGITTDLDLRLRQHSERGWWTQVRRIETKEYKSRESAAMAERNAIKDEHPRYNIQHNPQPPVRAVIPKTSRRGQKPNRNLVTLAEAADFMNVCTRTIRRRISDGTLRAYRISGSRAVRVDLEEVEALLVPIPTMIRAAEMWEVGKALAP